MTEKEVIERLAKSAYRTTCYGNKVVEHEENLVAIKALEKQIAKKPIDRCMFSECPTCGNVEIQCCGYCPDCGQKLDWC